MYIKKYLIKILRTLDFERDLNYKLLFHILIRKKNVYPFQLSLYIRLLNNIKYNISSNCSILYMILWLSEMKLYVTPMTIIKDSFLSGDRQWNICSVLSKKKTYYTFHKGNYYSILYLYLILISYVEYFLFNLWYLRM